MNDVWVQNMNPLHSLVLKQLAIVIFLISCNFILVHSHCKQ